MTLPIIDYQNINAAELDRQCRESGFFYLANHAIDKELEAAFAAAQDFFALPPHKKQEIAIEHSACHRGWFHLGGEILDGQTHPEGDYKEGIKIGRDLAATHPRVKAGIPLHGANQYADLDGWRTTMDRCYAACETVSRNLMAALAEALALPPTYFDSVLCEPMATLAPLYYPPLPQNTQKISAGAHTDFGCLTLLAQKDIGGLEICGADDIWRAVPPLNNMLVVNIGDMLERWTAGRYRSTRHRVQNKSGCDRYSIAYFFDPDPDADLSPLPNCVANYSDPKNENSGQTALEHLLHKIETSFAYRNS